MIYYEEPNAVVYQGHALDILKQMPAESVDCVITSPPYWGLRSYKAEPIIWGDNDCEHEWDFLDKKWHSGTNAGQKQITDKGAFHNDFSSQSGFCLKCGAWKGQLGLEPTIELYVSHLLEIFDEVKRVLKKTGTCWVNMGDSYASSWGSCRPNKIGNPSRTERFDKTSNSVPEKSLCLIPERFALEMVERGWILRNNIIWYKSNPMPESCKDRFTGTYEYLYFFVKNKRYWFEQQFEQYTEPLNRWGGDFTKPTDTTSDIEGVFAIQEREGRNRRPNDIGRNKRDVWEINTQPYPDAHFAVFPEKLVETPILSGCPSQICKKCGRARERILETRISLESGSGRSGCVPVGKWEGGAQELSGDYDIRMGPVPRRIDVGYTDCGCNAGFESGVVMDIFAGSGTTGAVAKRLGRKYIGIELSEEYCKLHKKRLQAVPLAMELI